MADDRYQSTIVTMAGLAVIMAMAERFVPPVARLVVGLPFVVFLPGFTLLNAVVGARLRSSIFLTLSVGLSLAITVVWGFILNGFTRLTPLSWTLALTGTTLAGVWLRPRIVMPMMAATWLAELKLRPRQRDMILIAAGLMAASVVSARIGAAAYRPQLVTEFFALPAGSGAQNTFTVGIRNREGQPMVYDVRLMLDGQPVGTREGVALKDLELWTEDFPVALQPDENRRLEAWLIRTDDPQTIYRRVWLSAHPTFSPTGSPVVNPAPSQPPEPPAAEPDDGGADGALPTDTN